MEVKITVEMEPHELRELISMGVNGIQPIQPARASMVPTATPGEIRAWAKSRRLPVSSKGMIPKDVKALYYEERYMIGV